MYRVPIGVPNRGAKGQLPLPKLLGVGSAPPQELKTRDAGRKGAKGASTKLWTSTIFNKSIFSFFISLLYINCFINLIFLREYSHRPTIVYFLCQWLIHGLIP